MPGHPRFKTAPKTWMAGTSPAMTNPGFDLSFFLVSLDPNSSYADAMDLQGKTVLVTGASSGIGKAIALAFAQKRAQVLVHYGKNKTGAQETLGAVKRLSSGSLHQADLMDRDQIAELFADIKKATPAIDVLVNNAGDSRPGGINDDEVWNYEYKNILLSAVQVSRAFLRRRICARSSTSLRSMGILRPASRTICSTPPSRRRWRASARR
jgi:NAD(P)-dependent dehydrogenase (short-subunit alcohol dehydrogenase family)